MNSSILKVCELKFSIYAMHEDPSFSTSLRRNVATWVCDMPILLWTFFPTLMINILKRFVFASKVNMCHWSFSGMSRLKRFAATAAVLFFDLISNALTFFSSELCERTKKLAVQPLRLKRNQISVLKCCMTKKMPISSFSLFCC